MHVHTCMAFCQRSVISHCLHMVNASTLLLCATMLPVNSLVGAHAGCIHTQDRPSPTENQTKGGGS